MKREQMVQEAALILGWLEKHPEERTYLLWQAAQEQAEVKLGFASVGSAGAAVVASHREHIRRFMQAAHFCPCPNCFMPVVFLDFDRKLSWPGLEKHTCPSDDDNTPGSQMAGSSPAGGATPPRRLMR